jgi:hypothetical protein
MGYEIEGPPGNPREEEEQEQEELEKRIWRSLAPPKL